MTSFFERLGRLASRRRGALIVLYLAASLLFLLLGLRIRFETSLADLLPRGTPSADDFRDLLESGGSLDRLWISVRLASGAGDPADRAGALAEAAAALAGELEATGLFRSVRFSISEEEILAAAERSIRHLPVLIAPERAPDLAARLDPGAIRESLAALRRRAGMPALGGLTKETAARDPLGLLSLLRLPSARADSGAGPDPESGLFLSPDGRALLIVAEPVRPPTEIAFSRRLIAAVEEAEVRAALPRPAGARPRFDHAGGHAVALEDERRVRHDAAATSLFSAAGLAAVYLAVLRRPALWLAVLVPITMSTVWTLGMASIHPGRLNMVTVAFAAILLGIGDDAMIHLYLRERDLRRGGTPASSSVAAALGTMGPAVVLATATTAAAFVSLAFVRFRGLSELGVIAALGMVNLLAGVLLFYPAALSWLASREERRPAPSLRLPAGPMLAAHDACARRRRWVLGAAGWLTLLALAGAARTRVATDLKSIRGEDPAARALERVLAPFGGAAAETMVVLHGAREAPPGATPSERAERGLEDAERLEPLCARLVASGRAASCDVPSAAVPSGAAQRRRFAAASAIDAAAAAARFEEAVRESGMNPAFFAGFTESLRGWGDWEKARVPLEPAAFGPAGVPATTIRFARPSDAPLIAGEVRRALGGRPARIASVDLVAADLGRIISEDFGRAALLVGMAVSLMLLAAFSQARSFLLAITPVVLGLVWMLGAFRLAGVELNLMSLMALPIVLGLGVDYGVYLMDRWEREGRDRRAALAGAGPAILVTGLTTLAGFAALLAARLAGLRSLGWAVVAGTGFTLAAALIILPLLLPSRE